MLSLCCYAGFSLVLENGDYGLVVVHRLLIAVAFLVAERGLLGGQASIAAARGLDSQSAATTEPQLLKPISPRARALE